MSLKMTMTPADATPVNIEDFPKAWLLALEEKFGVASAIREVTPPGKPRVYVYYFENWPEKGHLTAVTCGLSVSGHKDWKHGTPELMVSMRSNSHGWGASAGYFVSSFFGEESFSYGQTFKLDRPLADDCSMNCYLLAPPPYFVPGTATFDVAGKTVHLVGAYPLYDDELATYERVGFEPFFLAEGFDRFNPKRARVYLR
ncbi:MAG: suppressor of fused domain protein [Pseudomonadota bacterium]